MAQWREAGRTIHHESMEFSGWSVPAQYRKVRFVMGDNWNHSFDSRFYRLVPVDHVLGKVAIQF